MLALVVAGRRASARDVARFIPDCIGLVRRLLGDPRVPRRHKLLLGAVVGYLALPFDLVPDFLPVVGQVDDVLVVWLALRVVLGGSGERATASALARTGKLARDRAALRGRSTVAFERLGAEDVDSRTWRGGVESVRST